MFWMKETQNKTGKNWLPIQELTKISMRTRVEEKERKGTKQKCPSYAICYIAGNFSQAAHALIGYFEVT